MATGVASAAGSVNDHRNGHNLRSQQLTGVNLRLVHMKRENTYYHEMEEHVSIAQF